MPVFHLFSSIVGLSCLGVAAAYAVLTLVAVLHWEMRRAAIDTRRRPPVTILKPLCGAEPDLYEHLRSFCQQDYAEFQIVFGVQDPADPALAVVNRVVSEFPSLPVDLVISAQQHGDNYKISNLINMMTRASHDLLVIADSDTWVGPDYLAKVTAPLQDPKVGMVTCLYCDVPTPKISSRLGAMYINEWYMPSVLLARLFGFQGYASGQTMCVRRETLQAIGGLRAIVNDLADDYRLGELVRGLGLRIVLSPYLVKAQHDESNFDSLVHHELRWMHTIRILRPNSFKLLFLSFSLPLAGLGMLFAAAKTTIPAIAWILFAVTLSTRLIVHFLHRFRGDGALLSDFWLLPARDILFCWVWCRSFFVSRVTWRGNKFDVGADGLMRRPS
jgi:ceramide glucosyltransferase